MTCIISNYFFMPSKQSDKKYITRSQKKRRAEDTESSSSEEDYDVYTDISSNDGDGDDLESDSESDSDYIPKLQIKKYYSHNNFGCGSRVLFYFDNNIY